LLTTLLWIVASVQTAQAATPTFVQTRAAEINSGTTNPVSFSSANGDGNLIVAYVIWNNTGSVTLSDTRGNAYLSAGQRMTWNGSSSSQVFYARNIVGGANTVTATFASAINGFGIVYIHEYSGVDKSDPVDGQSTAIGTTSGMNSGSVSTTRDNDLLFNAGASKTDVTAGDATYTTRSTSFGNRTQDRLAATTGLYSALMTQNGNGWVSHLVAFKADTGSTDNTLPQVSVTAPANGASVNGIVNVTADATDDVGVARVQFLVDGVDTGTPDSTAPYALAWDTRSVPNGAHTLRARAFDAAGNSRLSAGVDVNVANTSSFQNEILLQGGLDLPTAMKFLPDGRLLVSELQGKIRVLQPPYTSADSSPFLQITNIGVAGVQQGIYDFVLDPNFSVNRFYYVFYTLGSPNHDRVSRFTANALATSTLPGSELVLYEDQQDADAEHHGGALNFGNDGKLYFTTGEHFVASASQDLSNPRGKIHRINPDGTVPTDNPFYDGNGPNYDSVWARGLRNPYRAYYDAPTDRLLIGDVGGNDSSTAIEEVELGARGANYGWPNVEGPCSAPCTSPIYSYAHNGRDSAITGGFVYHGDQFPSSYKGSYFFADYTQNWIKRLTFGANGQVTGVFNFEPPDGRNDGPYGDIVYLVEGPEGALYYLDLGYSDISGTFGISKLRRIRFISGDQPPVAAADATPKSGPAPLTVNFSSAGSSDPEGRALTYSWTFGDGQTSTAANPAHTYTQQGTYQARLSVSDGTNSTLSTPITITVGAPPTASILTPTDGATFRAGDVINFSGDATDPDDGALAASAFTWNVDFLHDGHVHPGLVLPGSKSGSFTIPTTGHDFSGNTRYRITLTVTDSAGLTDTKSVVVWPQKVNLTLRTLPAGGVIYLDGIARTTPTVYDTLVGYQHTIEARDQTIGTTDYTFDTWSDGGAKLHTITVPATDQTYTATMRAVPVTTQPAFVQTAAAESTSGSTTSLPFTSANTAGNLIVAYVIWNNTGGVSLSDSRGNAYASAGTRTTWGSSWSSQVFYAKNIAGGANTVTATFANALSGWGVVYVHEYSGTDRTDPLDVQTAATGTSAAMNSGNVTTTRANDLLFSGNASSSTVTAGGTGYTTRSTTFGNRTQDRIAGAPGTYNATASQNSNSWVSQLVAFKAANAAPPNQPPVASAAATPRSGSAPLDVSFSSAGSSDPEGQALSYSWTFGDGQTSTQANPTHTYQQQGSYSARLAVSDGTNTTLSAPITITVGSPPTGSILTPSDGATFRAGDVISYSGDGNDPDDGALPASAYSWSVDFLRGTTVEPIQATQGKTGSFTIPTTGRDFSGNTRYRITLTVKDSAGLTDTKSVTLLPQKVNLTFATSPTGGTVHVDGVAKSTPAVVDTLVGSQFTIEARDQVINGNNYTFDTWSDGGAKLHTITAPTTAQTYTATMKAVVSTAPPAFVQARAGESNSGTTSAVAFTNNNTTGNLIVAYVIWNNTGTVVLSDSRGNTYAPAGARRSWGTSGRWSSQVFYAKNIAGGANTVTATFATALGGGWGTVYVHEYSGVDRTSPFDVETASIGTSRAMSTGPVTTTSASLLFSGGASSHRVIAAGPDFTTRSTAFDNRTMDRISFAAGTYSASMTQDQNQWVQHLVAFRSAATPGGAN
jgi:glucose/arabinose dehydrogenase/PKD repeat protein